jgi:hypothetical protein
MMDERKWLWVQSGIQVCDVPTQEWLTIWYYLFLAGQKAVITLENTKFQLY